MLLPELQFNDILFQKLLYDETVDLILTLSKMRSSIKKEEFEKFLEVGPNLMNTFFTDLFDTYTQEEKVDKLKFGKVSNFVEYLAKNSRIPFSLSDLREDIKKIRQILSDQSDLEAKANNIFELVSNFCARLHQYFERR